MAGDWIKFELSTLDKPEVCQIADLANIDMDAVVGKLLRVWGWFDQHTESGNAPSVSKRLLDRAVGVSGFCDFMIQVGWMDEIETPDGKFLQLPNFERHNGKTAKNRLLTAKRVANCKASKRQGNDKGNGGSVSDALPREDVDVDKDQKQKPPVSPGGEGLPPAAPPAAKPTKFDPLSACPPNVSPEVWAEWVQCRKEQGKPLKETTCAAQAKQLANHPNADAVVEKSIAAGWTGLFPEKVIHASSQQPDRQGPRSAVDDVKQAILAREAGPAPAGQAVAEDGGDLRTPLDGEFRRVG
jgi:hypothetical protein